MSVKSILRRSKESERMLGRWLMQHDGPDPRPEYQPGAGIVTSTGRVGHIYDLGFDAFSRSYAAENKNVILNATWSKWWLQVLDRAVKTGKHALLRVEPSNRPGKIPPLHIISEERHAELLRKEQWAESMGYFNG